MSHAIFCFADIFFFTEKLCEFFIITNIFSVLNLLLSGFVFLLYYYLQNAALIIFHNTIMGKFLLTRFKRGIFCAKVEAGESLANSYPNALLSIKLRLWLAGQHLIYVNFGFLFCHLLLLINLKSMIHFYL